MSVFLIVMLVIFGVLTVISLLVLPTQIGKRKDPETAGTVSFKSFILLVQIGVTILLILDLLKIIS